MFGAELFSRAEPVSQPALDPGNPSFSEEDFAHVDAFAPAGEFAPISESEDDDRPDLEAAPVAYEAAPEASEKLPRRFPPARSSSRLAPPPAPRPPRPGPRFSTLATGVRDPCAAAASSGR